MWLSGLGLTSVGMVWKLMGLMSGCALVSVLDPAHLPSGSPMPWPDVADKVLALTFLQSSIGYTACPFGFSLKETMSLTCQVFFRVLSSLTRVLGANLCHVLEGSIP